MIVGETVILRERVKVGVDSLNIPVYEEHDVIVENVLVGSPSTDGITAENNIDAGRVAFTLGIPKGDSHNWENVSIIIRGDRYKSVGRPLTQTEANVPGPWNTQVKVERNEQQ